MKLLVMLDRVRSVYNVGSFFRTCDSAGVDKLLLTGWCAFPPHNKLNKTALGSLESVDWEHHCSAIMAVKYLQAQGIYCIAMETTETAENIFEFDINNLNQDICLIFGHEEGGVQAEVLALVDKVIKIPQYGIKESLNVASAGAVGIYEMRRKMNRGKYGK